MDNRLLLGNPPGTPTFSPRRSRRTQRTGSPPWRMSDEARRTGREGIAQARRELERARAHLDPAANADAA